ncbi:MAG: xanthine dehydrogenase family protein molybdopterin-binding subunit [Devosia sp.]|uniref:xanthine dehydrogenase family protein molybdopterin-binding subunit n=1 Tax=Devosia sp. TaxID=1871048 RepID=UPI001A394C54|nr:xanthine dehydrogenase family protein molybdopterin-binding subunit [Devosia sp.]MBL8596949.1 xanthine dehydrogenase family protein molybdopterin-binding subunit [Devosia sp.]
MIGDGINRTEGPRKVAGQVPYSAERRDAGDPLHGFVRGAAIGSGRIIEIDTTAAEAAPGVRLVLTHRNAPPQGDLADLGGLHDAKPELVDDRIVRYGQPVALVVADSFEQARAAAMLIEVGYDREPADFDFFAHAGGGEVQDVSAVGDFEQAFAEAPVSIDATYTTPYHFGHPMEPNAAIADWRDGHLTVYLTAQMLNQLLDGLALTLMLDKADITIDSAYVGGGFGSKIGLHCEAVLASLATRILERPVKLAMTRRQMFSLVGHRAASQSRIRLGATADGRLTALGHDAHVQTTIRDDWREPVANVARALYAAPNRLTRRYHVELDVGAPEPVRGPGELPGLMVFESAVDELAEKLGMDPVELRLRNDTQIDPEKSRPLNGRRLADCLREGAERFGWDDRPIVPASRRDGDWLIGYGVASSIRSHWQMATDVRVRIDPAGLVTVQSDMTDLGTGTYTIMAQVAASALNVPVEQVQVELGRTDHPKGWGSGGSWGSGNMSVATDRACSAVREKVFAAAGKGFNDIFAEVRRHFPNGVEAIGHTIGANDDPNYKAYSQFTYGASFAEVGVDAHTGEVRLRRMLGVFSFGRVLNAKTARSQLLGGMIWGVSAALHEGGDADPRYGHWVNGDLAEYLIPTHADIPAIDAIMLDDFDEHANHMGVKGIGELGAGGTGGSVANAVYNATGVRVRDFPITLGRLLPGLIARG